jgi:hypothetical protein
MSTNSGGARPGVAARGDRSTRTRTPLPTPAAVPSQSPPRDDDGDSSARAKANLIREGWLSSTCPPTTASLATALTNIAHNVPRIPKPALDGITAVALLLNSMADPREQTSLADRVNDAIAPTIERLDTTATETREAIAQLLSRSQDGASAIEELREETHAIHTLRDQLNLTLNELTQRTGRLARDDPQAGGPNTAGVTDGTRHDDPQLALTPSPQSYVAAVQAALSPGHGEVLARSQDRKRQVVIERDAPSDGSTAHQEDSLTEKVLVEKANAAIDLMGDAIPGRPPIDRLFLGAQRLPRGRTLYLMANEGAADWLRREDVKKGFIAHYGTPIKVRGQGYRVICEYVPVSFDPNASTASVEVVNDLPAGAIMEARYLKDPSRRPAGQRTAFVLLTFRTAKQANKALREGLIIEGKKVFGRKDIQEARRCLKCQGYAHRHMAANCPQIHDTCAVCGGLHRTTDCPMDDGKRFCVNCKTDDHTASSKNCLTFIAECGKVNYYFPENKYRFYPVVDDPSTWDLLQPFGTPTPTVTPLPAPTLRPRPTTATPAGTARGGTAQRTPAPTARHAPDTSPDLRDIPHPRDAAPRPATQGRRPAHNPSITFQPPPSDSGWSDRNRGKERANAADNTVWPDAARGKRNGHPVQRGIAIRPGAASMGTQTYLDRWMHPTRVAALTGNPSPDTASATATEAATDTRPMPPPPSPVHAPVPVPAPTPAPAPAASAANDPTSTAPQRPSYDP